MDEQKICIIFLILLYHTTGKNYIDKYKIYRDPANIFYSSDIETESRGVELPQITQLLADPASEFIYPNFQTNVYDPHTI